MVNMVSFSSLIIEGGSFSSIFNSLINIWTVCLLRLLKVGWAGLYFINFCMKLKLVN